LRQTSFFQSGQPARTESVFDPFATNKTPRFEVDTKRTDTLEEAEVKILRLGMSPTEHNRLLFGRRKYSSSDDGSLDFEVKNYNSEIAQQPKQTLP